MTAGIAAPRPAAVATRASEIPGATTARLADPCAPMPWNEFMTPITVPNKPMNGHALELRDLQPRRPAHGALGRLEPIAAGLVIVRERVEVVTAPHLVVRGDVEL